VQAANTGHGILTQAWSPIGRSAENIDVFDFTLTTAELDAIDALDTGVRGGPEPSSITLEGFGRPIPES